VILTVIPKDQDTDAANSALEETTANVRNAFGAGLQSAAFSKRGELVPVIQEMVNEHHPDLIVMGTKGASGLKEVLIGSNTVNVMSKVTLPILVIPENARFEAFLDQSKNRIVLATDLDSVDNEAGLELLKEIAMLIIKPFVKVLSVRPKNTDLDYMKRMQRDALLGLFSPEIESERVTVFSSNVLSGVNFYLDKNVDTGLVAMIARDSGHLIQRHYTREMASHTHLPLLVLHDSKN
jgi:hypothetical protein